MEHAEKNRSTAKKRRTTATPGAVFVSDLDLATRYTVNRTTIWRWVQDRGFPAPVKISPGCTRWHLASVEAWESEQGAAA